MFRIEHKNRAKTTQRAPQLRPAIWDAWRLVAPSVRRDPGCRGMSVPFSLPRSGLQGNERPLQFAAMPYRSILSLSDRRVIWSCSAARV
jgi:hypothetical protein